MDLLYHSEKNTLKDSDPKEYEYIIVTKDMRKDYPKEGAPELARLYEWFDKDKEMDLADATEKVRNAALKKAEEMAKEHKIVYVHDSRCPRVWISCVVDSAELLPELFGRTRSAMLSTWIRTPMLYASKVTWTLMRRRKHLRK